MPGRPAITRPDPGRPGLALAAERLLPAVALAVLATGVVAVLGSAGETLGYDFRAYHAAAIRVLEGRPAYDLGYDAAGPAGLFYYPPTFLLAVLPLALLPEPAAFAAWTVLSLAALGLAVALLPVRARTRWLVLLLAGLSWPVLYGLKLGQVGALLLLVFAAGWRGLDRAPVLGGAAAIGAAVKLQPGILLAWALLVGRRRSVVAGVAVLAVLAAAATVVTGPAAWGDLVILLSRVTDPVTTPGNVTPGALAYRAGLGAELAALVQLVATLLVLLAVVVAARRRSPVASYLVAVVASQLLSPILWDHYAQILLLPVAWLLDRGRAWAAALPLSSSILLVGIVPAAVHPVAFAVTIAALLAERDGRGTLHGTAG